MKNLNMIRLLSFIGCCILLITFQSCGSKKNNLIKVKPETTNITGSLSDFIEIIPNEYDVVPNDNGAEIAIKIKAKAAMPSDLFEETNYRLTLSLLKENGMPAPGGMDFYIVDIAQLQQLKAFMLKGAGDQIVTFSMIGGNSSEVVKSINDEEIKKFSVSSLIEEKANAVGASTETNLDSKNAANTDCDQFIKDYEAFADSYIKLLKKYKANPSDPTILQEYSDAAQKASEMQTGASNCTDSKYMNKLTKIINKLSAAAASLN